jgi:hypothetical protein
MCKGCHGTEHQIFGPGILKCRQAGPVDRVLPPEGCFSFLLQFTGIQETSTGVSNLPGMKMTNRCQTLQIKYN